MDSLAVSDVPVSSRPSLSGRAILGMIVLAVVTVLLTWRASVIETTLKDQEEQPALVDKPAPDFSAVALDGRTVSLSDFRGQKKVVVTFWASWCGPCRMEMPTLTEFYKKNHTDSSDFEILAISIDEDPKEAASFASAQKLNFPVLLDPRQGIANSYGVEGIPTMFVIDKNGKVIFGRAGFEATMQYQLTHALGIKDKSLPGGANGAASD